MAIVDSELKFYRSAVITDDGSNGGVMSPNVISSNVQQNVFPHVFKSGRDNGETKYRKIFCKVDNDDDATLFAGKAWLDNPTPGDDFIIAWIGDHVDTQAAILGTERKFGSAVLQTDVVAGSSTVIVTVEDVSLTTGNDQIFQDTDEIIITNKLTPDAVAGTIETHTISGAPTVVGNDVTITIVGTFASGYTVTEGARVSSVMNLGDIVATTESYVVTSTSGTFDDTQYPVLADNIGSEYDTITIAFTDATNFTVTGARLGNLGSGTIGSNFISTNSDFSKPYLTIQSAAFGGTFANADTVVFDLIPASKGIWQERTVPAGSASLSGNNTVVVFTGEAA